MHRRAFTLIELLVVISIIGLLSSVVLASLNSAREKGRLGGAKYFATQVDHTVGDQAVALWDFDECGASAPKDRSGFGNNGSYPMTPPVSSPDTPLGKGCSLLFDGSSGYVDIGTSDLGIVDRITISAWVKASTLNPYASVVSKHMAATGGSWKFGVDIDGKRVRFDIFSSPTVYTTVSVGSIPDGFWHNIVGTYDGSIAIVYIDGVKKGSTPIAGGVNTSTANIEIGNDGCCGSRIWNGTIDSVHIFAKALTASEVGILYASAAPKFKLADGIQ